MDFRIHPVRMQAEVHIKINDTLRCVKHIGNESPRVTKKADTGIRKGGTKAFPWGKVARRKP